MWFFVSPCVYVKVVYAATVTPTTFLLDLHVITKYVHILDSTPDTLTANMYRRCIRDSVCGILSARRTERSLVSLFFIFIFLFFIPFAK